MNLREQIRKTLKEEVNKKYPRPNENLNKAVYSWLSKYFSDSKIYEDEYWKNYGFGFQFCKNGREIGDLGVVFDDKSPDFGPRDPRPTSERSVKEVWLYVYPNMVEMMQKVFPVRKNYLMYLIEEWFEDTYLNEIQQKFNRNDLSFDYVTLANKSKGDICVPPMTKPEDVEKQEMMDYIKANTLFSYRDMEEHEEEEPGWIERTYLQKLRQLERERVNKQDDDEY